MSYHTFELRYQLSYQEKESLINILRKKGCIYIDYYDFMHPTVSEALVHKGIIIKFVAIPKNDFTFHMMYLVINPRRVMEQNNYIGIFDSRDTEKMLKKVDKQLQKLTPYMPSVHSCRLNRIDFCSNIIMNSQDEVANYLKLLKRGRITKKYSIDTYYDPISKHQKMYEDSITFSNKNVSVTYYNKYSQLHQNSHCQNIDDAKNILRAEIQCKKSKVKYLEKKFGCYSVQEFLERSDEIGEYVFNSCANIFYGEGDFYKLDEIYRIIDNSNLKKKTKIKMKEFAQTSSKCKGLGNALYELKLSFKEEKDIMKKFNKIGVSPVIIPRRNNYDRFKNPLTLALDWYGCI